ncbi:hypothetical protein BGZ50_008512 [Haplosporangium sp. Z 11]|nr:hypothetical protein BGZ50_008512 [Haplosporangium sp. Z 11]
MDILRKPAQARRSKRQASSRKAPYIRPEAGSSNSAAGSSDQLDNKTRTPSWRKRLERFIIPWRQDSSDSESETENAEDTEQVQEEHETNGSVDQPTESIEIEMESTIELIQVTEETSETIGPQDEDDAAPAPPMDDSQTTLVAPSLEFSSVSPDGSVVGDGDDQDDHRQQLEREESLISGQDSDAGIERKEQTQSKRKRGSRSSTPVRSTRRTTRSQAARVDDVVTMKVAEEPSVEDNTPVEQETATLESTREIMDEPMAELTIPAVEITEEPVAIQNTEPTKGKGGKKKKKGKKGSKRRNKDEVEELKQELIESDARIAEKIQESQDLIDASQELLQKSAQLDDAAEHVLLEDNMQDPFSEPQDDEDGEEDDQTFHSTTQFEAAEAVEDEEKETEEPRYPVIDYEETKYYPPEEEDEEESADTVKYYPPDSPAAEETPEVEGENMALEQEMGQEPGQGSTLTEYVEALDTTYDVDSEGRDNSPSPLAAESVLESELVNPEEYEFSPMQSRSSSPLLKISTPSSLKERFVDCPPIITPKTEKTRRISLSPEPTPTTAHPSDNIAVLANFFNQQKGHLLTRKQYEFCRQLIDEAVIPPKNKAWLHGEDGVSFRTPSNAPHMETQIKPQVAATVEQPPPPQPTSIPSMDDATTSAPSSGPVPVVSQRVMATTSVRTVRPIIPFEVKRQAVSDLYHEAKENSPKRPRLPSKEEYLELKKYEGVEWDDLPNHVKVKRYLEWRGTEPPEVVKKRKLEERQLMKEKNAEVWGRDEKSKDSGLATQTVSALKRTVSTSGIFSDEEDGDNSAHKKTLTKPAAPQATLPIAVSAAVDEVVEKAQESVTKVSSVAQKLLDIVGKGPNVDEKKETETTKTTSVSSKDESSMSVSTKPFATVLGTKAAQESLEPSKPAAEGFSFTKPATAPTEISTTAPTVGSGFTTGMTSTTGSGSIFASPAPAKIEASHKPLFGASIQGTSSSDTTQTSTSKSPQPAFSFSAPKVGGVDALPKPTQPTFNFAVPASKTDSIAPLPKPTMPVFNFGLPVSKVNDDAASSKSMQPTFNFGIPAPKKDDVAVSPKPTMPIFNFGVPAAKQDDSTVSPKPAMPIFNFGVPAPKSPSATAMAAPTGSSFSISSASNASAAKNGSSPWGLPSAIAFGTSETLTKQTPESLTANLDKNALAPSFASFSPSTSTSVFGSSNTSFGQSSEATSDVLKKPSSLFGSGQSPSRTAGFEPSQSLSVNPFAAFAPKPIMNEDGGKPEMGSSPNVITLSDDEDKEQQTEKGGQQVGMGDYGNDDEVEQDYNDQADSDDGDDSQYYIEDDGEGSYDDRDAEGSYGDREDEESQYGASLDSRDNENIGSDRGDDQSDTVERFQSRPQDSRSSALSAFKPSTGFAFGQSSSDDRSRFSAFSSSITERKFESSKSSQPTEASGFGNTAKASMFSSFATSSSTSSSKFGQQPPKTPEFSFDFGRASTQRLSGIERHGSPTLDAKGPSASFSSSSQSGFGTFGSQPKTSTFGFSAPAFGQDDKENNNSEMGQSQGSWDRYARGSISEYEMSPFLGAEYDSDTEDGQMSPLASPVLSPRPSY